MPNLIFTAEELGLEPGPACGALAPISPCVLPAGHPTGSGLPGHRGHLTARHQLTVEWLNSIGVVIAQPAPDPEPVPDGMISSAELIEFLNHYDDGAGLVSPSWCSDADDLMGRLGVNTKDGRGSTGWGREMTGPRFVATDNTPKYINKDDLARVMRYALDEFDDDAADVCDALTKQFQVQPEPQYNDTYAVTFKVTAEQIREYAHEYGIDWGAAADTDEEVVREQLWTVLRKRMEEDYDSRYLAAADKEFDYTITPDPERPAK